MARRKAARVHLHHQAVGTTERQLQDLGLYGEQVGSVGIALDRVKNSRGGTDAFDLVIIDRGLQGRRLGGGLGLVPQEVVRLHRERILGGIGGIAQLLDELVGRADFVAERSDV